MVLFAMSVDDVLHAFHLVVVMEDSIILFDHVRAVVPRDDCFYTGNEEVGSFEEDAVSLVVAAVGFDLLEDLLSDVEVRLESLEYR